MCLHKAPVFTYRKVRNLSLCVLNDEKSTMIAYISFEIHTLNRRRRCIIPNLVMHTYVHLYFSYFYSLVWYKNTRSPRLGAYKVLELEHPGVWKDFAVWLCHAVPPYVYMYIYICSGSTNSLIYYIVYNYVLCEVCNALADNCIYVQCTTCTPTFTCILL